MGASTDLRHLELQIELLFLILVLLFLFVQFVFLLLLVKAIYQSVEALSDVRMHLLTADPIRVDLRFTARYGVVNGVTHIRRPYECGA